MRRALIGAVVVATVAPAPASAETTSLTFRPEADTFVDSLNPDAGYGRDHGMWVDADPDRRSFMRFWPAGLAGRTVTGVRLHLNSLDPSDHGGALHLSPSMTWGQDAVSWNARPSLGDPLGVAFGAVSGSGSYSVSLPASLATGGAFTLGMRGVSTNGVRWATSDSSTPPRLVVDVETPPGFVADGMSVVALPMEGSSEPTEHASNRRVVATAGGRTLVLHGRHSDGVRLAWRDDAVGADWTSRTRGATTDGAIIAGTGTGDWTASIALVPGADEAWVAWAGPNSDAGRPVRIRRLTELDRPAGPLVGPAVTVEAPAGGAFRADVAFEAGPDGAVRGCVLWSSFDGSRTAVKAAWFSPRSDQPAIEQATSLYSSSSSGRFGALVPGPGAMHAVLRASGGHRAIFRHPAGAGAGWEQVARGPYTSSTSAPNGVALDSGALVLTAERDNANDVTDVLILPPNGTAVQPVLELAGYSEPAITTDGDSATVVMVRRSDGLLVSRTMGPDGTWTTQDRVELGAAARGRARYPNLARVISGGRLRLIAEGRDGTPYRSAVLAWQRPVG